MAARSQYPPFSNSNIFNFNLSNAEELSAAIDGIPFYNKRKGRDKHRMQLIGNNIFHLQFDDRPSEKYWYWALLDGMYTNNYGNIFITIGGIYAFYLCAGVLAYQPCDFLYVIGCPSNGVHHRLLPRLAK
jgi:hypothetical protein